MDEAVSSPDETPGAIPVSRLPKNSLMFDLFLVDLMLPFHSTVLIEVSGGALKS